jgi:hypothetical protein
MSEHIDESVNRVKRYYLARNRDHERVMSEITERDKPFLKIPGDEWVRAEDYDEAEQSRDINHAAAKMALDQRDQLAEAARALLAKIDAIHADPQYQSVWILRGHIPYTGPNYAGELRALRALIVGK